MPSTINADNGVVSGSSGVKTTADTSGVLALQSNGTTGLTLNTSLALGVGSGNSTGTSGQVLTSAGSGAAPTWVTTASAGSQSFTASGAIASAGLPVALNANGTVSTVANTAGSAAITLASSTATTDSRGRAMMFSSTSNVYVAVYRAGTSISAIAATLSGTTFTWGTAVVVATTCDYCAAAWDAVNDKFVVTVVTTGGNMDAYVLSTSGTTISVGGAVSVVATGSVGAVVPSMVYEATSGKITVIYVAASIIYANVGTVSGTTTSWSSETPLFGSNNCRYVQSFAVNGVVVFSASRSTANNYLYLQAGTISGSTLTLGTTITDTTTSVEYGTVSFSPVYNKYYWIGTDSNASSVISLKQFNVYGTTIVVDDSFIQTTISQRSSSQYASAYDPLANRIVVGYSAVTTGYGSVVSFLNPYSFGSPVTVQNLINSANSFVSGTLTYSSTAGKVVGATVGTSSRLYGAVITTEASSNTNTIGLSTASASDGASTTCTIIGGINTGVSGLTTNLNYYASSTGTLTTNPTNNFLLGRALSATSLLVTNGTFP